MPDAGELRWMTYAEMRDAFGLPSTKAALQRSRRAGWPRRLNNADKLARVGVPVEALAAPRNPSREVSRNPPSAASAEGPGVTGSLPGGVTDPHGVNAVLAELRQRADKAEARAIAAEDQTRELGERAGRLEGERDAALAEAARLRDDARAERDRGNAALERALTAEARLEAGSPGARALKAWRAFLARRRGS